MPLVLASSGRRFWTCERRGRIPIALNACVRAVYCELNWSESTKKEGLAALLVHDRDKELALFGD